MHHFLDHHNNYLGLLRCLLQGLLLLWHVQRKEEEGEEGKAATGHLGSAAASHDATVACHDAATTYGRHHSSSSSTASQLGSVNEFKFREKYETMSCK